MDDVRNILTIEDDRASLGSVCYFAKIHHSIIAEQRNISFQRANLNSTNSCGVKKNYTVRRLLRKFFVLGWLRAVILAALAFVSMANGQTVSSGTISGTVVDQSGAAVAGARVQITSETTHFVTPATSNGTGLYTARFLSPDTYDVVVTAKGFATAKQTGAVLLPGAVKEVDFKLALSSVSATVQVTVNQQMLSTGSATMDTEIPSKLIENTVNLGDNVFYLATRTADVYSNFTQGSEMSNWTAFSNGATGGIDVNGVNRTQVNVDGTFDLVDNGVPGSGAAGFTPPLYSVQELSVNTSEYDAQDGHNDGGIQDALIKSGGQQFHGDAYFVNGNRDFNANRWDRKGGATNNPQYPRIPVDWDQEGFAFMGPLEIPKISHGNHRTFFMVAYEHYYDYRGVVSSGPQYFSVPTVKERNGDFSELGATGGTGNGGNIIFDPTTTVPQGAPSNYASWCAGNPAANGQPAGCFPGERESFTQEYNEGLSNPSLCNGDTNCIPQSRWNLAGSIFAGAAAPTGYKQGIWPLPNTTSSTPATPYLNNYYPADYATADYYHSTIVRVDHEFNDSNKIYVDLAKGVVNNIANADAGFPDDEIGSAYVPQLQSWNMGIADYNRILSPTEVLDLHIGGMYHTYHLIRGGINYNPTNVGITGSLPPQLQNFPGMSFSGVGGSYMTLQNGVGADDYHGYIQGTALFAKSLLRHNLKVGYDMIYNQDDIIGAGSTSTLGTFGSTTQFTQENAGGTDSRVTGYGDGLASILLGYPAGNTTTVIQPKPAFRWNYWAVYLQDDWRTTNRLTMNLGVRFDYDSPVTTKNNTMDLGFDATDPNPFCLPNALGTAIVSCTPPPASAAVPQGYPGGLLFESNNVHLPYQHELWDRFQPRIGFAYRLTSKDVIRGGVGVTFSSNPTYQPLSGFSATSTFNGSINNFYTPPSCTAAQGGDAYGFCTLSNPYPNGVVEPTGSLLGLSTFLGQSISAVDRHFVYPKTTMYSLDVQHQFPSQVLVDIAYRGGYTTGMGIAKNLDVVPACYYITASGGAGDCPGAGINSILAGSVPNPMAAHMPASSSLNAATIEQSDLYVPYPEFTGVTITQTQVNNERLGTYNYNAITGDVAKRTTHGLTFHVSGTISKTMDKASYANNQDAQPAHYEDQQPNQFLEFDGSYSIPSIPTTNKIVRGVFDGWLWANSMNWQQENGAGWPGGVWPTGANPEAAHQQLNIYDQAASHWFNNCYIPLISSATTTSGPVWGPAQAPNAQGVEGPCNAGEQPAFKQEPLWALNTVSSSAEMSNGVRYLIGVYYNTSLARTFPIHERLSLEFRGDFYNPLNYTVLQGTINETVTATNFGTMTGLSQYNDPRFIRLRAILSF
jgi:Carboxypeptidase regulatory-like domain